MRDAANREPKDSVSLNREEARHVEIGEPRPIRGRRSCYLDRSPAHCGFRSSTASIREREVSRSSSGTNYCGSRAARLYRIWFASGRLHASTTRPKDPSAGSRVRQATIGCSTCSRRSRETLRRLSACDRRNRNGNCHGPRPVMHVMRSPPLPITPLSPPRTRWTAFMDAMGGP
jgi:hypothetical protein